MALLKLSRCRVIVLFFITQFHSATRGEDEGKRCLERLKRLATGYEHSSGRNDGKMMSEKKFLPCDVLHRIERLYCELECGYLYSAQFHLKSTRNKIWKNGKKPLRPEKINDISFDTEASGMIESLLDEKNDRLNDLWLLFMYARQVRDYFGYHTANGGKVNRDVSKDNKPMHVYVLSAIEARLEGCAADNYFNVKYKKHLSVGGERPEKMIPLSLLRKKTVRRRAIRRNKMLLLRNLNENRHTLQLSHSSKMTEPSFLIDGLLLFGDEEKFKSFCDQFLGTTDKEFPKFQSGLKGIKALGDYQRWVIGMLQRKMLEITLSYTVQLEKSDDVLAHANTFNDEIIDRFKDLAVFDDDTEFKRVHQQFVDCYLGRFSHEKSLDEDSFEQCKSNVNNGITQLIWDVTNRKGLPDINPADTDRDQTKTLIRVLTVSKSFLERIESDIGKNPIRLVQSFLKMIDEKSESFLS